MLRKRAGFREAIAIIRARILSVLRGVTETDPAYIPTDWHEAKETDHDCIQKAGREVNATPARNSRKIKCVRCAKNTQQAAYHISLLVVSMESALHP